MTKSEEEDKSAFRNREPFDLFGDYEEWAKAREEAGLDRATGRPLDYVPKGRP